MNGKFDCSKCGACCRQAPAELLKMAGLPVRPGGVGCANLLPDNSCAIYETRPTLCRVDKMFEKFQHKMSWEQYKAATAVVCAQLQENEK